jgi:general stress protein 26
LSERILAYSTVLRAMRRQHFAVLSTSDTAGHPASAGVTYGLTQSGEAMFVMTRRHLQKARNIAVNAAVSLVIPVPRRLLWPVPPATLQLHGHATIIDWTNAEAREVFSGFPLGRQIINSYEQLHHRGESRICGLRIDLDPVIRTYLFGNSIWRARRRMESGSAIAVRP